MGHASPPLLRKWFVPAGWLPVMDFAMRPATMASTVCSAFTGNGGAAVPVLEDVLQRFASERGNRGTPTMPFRVWYGIGLRRLKRRK